MPNYQHFVNEEPMTYTTLQNVPCTEHIGPFDTIYEISDIIPGDTVYAETTMEDDCLHLKIIEQPADTFRYRYKSEKGSHGGIKGENTARSKKSFPTVKLENCPPNLIKKVVIKVSLYTNELDPKPHVYELTGKNAGGATLDENFIAKFQQLAITTRKKEEVLEILKERKKVDFDSEGISYDEASVEAEAHEVMKNINLDSAKLCFEAFSTDNPNTPLCKKVFSNAINNQKSAATGDLKITRLSHFSGKCSGGDEMILLCDKVKKEDIKVRFYDEESGWEEYGEFNPAEIHHQVAIIFKTPRYQEENVHKMVCIELVRPSDGKHSDPRQFRYKPDDVIPYPTKIKPLNAQISRLVKNEESGISRKRRRANEENTESSESFFKDSSVALSPSSTDDEQFNIDDLNSMDFDNINLEELFPELLDVLPTGIQNPIDGQSEYICEYPELFQVPRIEAQMAIPPYVKADGMNEISESMGMLSLASRYAKQEQEKSKSRIASNDFVIGMKSILQNRNEKTYLHYAPDLISLQDENGNSMLHLGIMEQNENRNFILKMVKMASTDLINHQNIYRETPLHLAVKGNYVNILLLLLARGGDPNLCDRSGNNCLHLAAKHGHINCLKVLLPPTENRRTWKHEIRDIDVLNYDGMSALHLAVAGNFEDCVHFLLNCKADVNLSEKKSGKTTLHLAIEHPALLQAILKQPNVDFDAEDFGGYTAIQLACLKKRKNFEVVFEKLKVNKDEMIKFLESLNQDEEDCNSSCSEAESDEESSDASEFEDAVEEFSPISSHGVVSKTASTSKLVCTNEKKTNLMKIEEELQTYLDKNGNWKKLADFIGVSAEHLAVLDLGLSPGQTVLRKIKDMYPECQAQTVIKLLQFAGLEEGARILQKNS